MTRFPLRRRSWLRQLGVRRNGPLLAVVALACGAAIAAFGEDTHGASVRSETSVRVRAIDGDTVAVIGDGERIRLPNIDAPETGDRARCAAEREAGAAATAFVRAAVASKTVSLRRIGLDRYGRTLAYVRVDGRDLGDALIAAGHARRWTGRRQAWCGAKDGLRRT